MYNIFTDFQLGGKTLSSFGGVLYNEGNAKLDLLPSLNIQTTDASDGENITKIKLDVRVIELNIYIDNKNFNEQDFKNWLYGSKEPQWFNYVGDNKKVKVIYKDIVNLDVFNENQSTFKIIFYAHDPYWYLTTDDTFTKTSPIVNTTYTFENLGNVQSYPLIHIYTNGVISNVKFEINGLQINLAKVYNDIYLDSKYRTAYNFVSSVKNNRLIDYDCLNGKHKYSFPILNPNSNTFKLLSGSMTSIAIEQNARFI